jgi:hypothetical protein
MVATFCERLGESFFHLHLLTEGLVNRVFRGVRQEVGGGCGPGAAPFGICDQWSLLRQLAPETPPSTI